MILEFQQLRWTQWVKVVQPVRCEHRLPIITFGDFDTPDNDVHKPKFSEQIFCLNHPDFEELLIMHLKKARKPFHMSTRNSHSIARILKLNRKSKKIPVRSVVTKNLFYLILLELFVVCLCSWTPKFFNFWRIFF